MVGRRASVGGRGFRSKRVQIFKKPGSDFKIIVTRRATIEKFRSEAPTNTRHHGTKFSRLGDLKPGVCAYTSKNL